MLLSATGLIRAEENRILFEMCQTISQNRVEIKEAVTAIAEIDVYRAKAKVGARMKGVIPEVRPLTRGGHYLNLTIHNRDTHRRS